MYVWYACSDASCEGDTFRVRQKPWGHFDESEFAAWLKANVTKCSEWSGTIRVWKVSVNVYALRCICDDRKTHASKVTWWSPTCSELNQVLSGEISILFNWIKTNKLILNISKTKSIMFGSKYRLLHNPEMNIQIDGQIIPQVKTVKLLGLWLDCTLSWSDHINRVVAKMVRAVAITRKCAPFLNSQLLHQVVCSLILCHLDYCSVVWSAASKSLLNKLQVAQNKAARLVLGCSPRTSVAEMQRLTWLRVNDRLSTNVLIYLHRIINTQTPTFFLQ